MEGLKRGKENVWKWLIPVMIAVVLISVMLTSAKMRQEGTVTIDIHRGCVVPKVTPLSSIADSVEIVRMAVPFWRDRLLMLDTCFVVVGEDACLLLDRKGDSLRVIARQGKEPEEYKGCHMLNESGGLIYITDRDGVTKVYNQAGDFVEVYTCPWGGMDAVGLAAEDILVGYRVNYKGNEPKRLLFFGKDTLFAELPYQKQFGKPKGHFFFRYDGRFVRTAHTLLFKELLNDTIYGVKPDTYSLYPAYRLELDSLRPSDSLRYTVASPETELFCHTPYVMLLGEQGKDCWLSTVFSSYELMKQVYATHCYDHVTGQTYSLELKLSSEDMGKQSLLLYDSTSYCPPSTNWDNFFPEQMSADGQHLIAFRGAGMDRQILVIAHLKEDPMADFRPVSYVDRLKGVIPVVLLFLLIGVYYFFRYRKNKRAFEQLSLQWEENERLLRQYRREQQERSVPSDALGQQIYLLEMQNAELKKQLESRDRQAATEKPARLSVSDEGYNLFMKLKAEPVYIFIGEEEFAHLCRVTDLLYRQFATRLRRSYPELTKHDIETCCLLKAGLTNRELSIIFNNTPAAITKSKNRIKKRIGIGGEENLDTFLQTF